MWHKRKDFMASIIFQKKYIGLKEKDFDSIFEGCIFTGQMKGRNDSSINWVCDTRYGLANSTNLQVAADFFVDILDTNEIDQVIVKGYGAYQLLGSVLVSSHQQITGAVIREERKSINRERLLEGNFDTNKPILLMDDIINSGSSSIDAIKILKSSGFKICDVHCGFLINFVWGAGFMKLNQQGVKNQNIYYGMEAKI